MIVTEQLSKRFDDYLAVDGISLQIGSGEVLALLGPNGAGKTTTVRMLTSLLRPTSGKAWVAGFDVVERPDQVRASVGVLAEQHGLYNRMPAGEYLDFFGQIYGLRKEVRKQRIQELLEHFGLAEHRNRKLGEFSKGMRQKLALARTLLHEPPVLLLDEPTSAMDPESSRLVRDAIRDLRSRERTILICTHNLVEAEELADQIAIIRRGRVIARGSSAALKLHLLGPAEYEVRLTGDLNGQKLPIPSGAIPTGRGPDWFRYRTGSPQQDNPALLSRLVGDGFGVISLQEVPRSLEQVYLQAVNSADMDEVQDG